MLGLSGNAAWAQEPQEVWIGDLESRPELLGRQIAVEGRYDFKFGSDLIRLKRCNVEFRLDLATRFPPALHYVRLSGKLYRSQGKLVMLVTRLQKLPSDAERYNREAQRIGPNDSRSWFELAERTQKTADFYEDKELAAVAQQARIKGVQAKEAALESPQYEELFDLIERAKQVRVKEYELRRMRHKGLRWQSDWLAARAASVEQWQRLADQMRLLPGATIPIRRTDQDALEQYHAEPLELYKRYPSARDTYDREFFIEVTTRRLRAEAAQQKTNLFALSEEASRLLPDRLELAHQLLARAADQEALRLAQLPVGSVSATQVRKLASIFHNELGKPGRAAQVLRRWLDARRDTLARRDAEGRYHLARNYRSDLGDDQSAVELLNEALEIDPKYTEAAEELRALGWVKSSKGWVRSDTAAALSRGLRQGRSRLVAVGMTPEQVREVLGAPKPKHILRVGTARGVVETWLYKGPPDIFVSFQWNGPSGARVVIVKTLPSSGS